MATQLNSAKRGVATDEIIQVAREEQVDISFIPKKILQMVIL